MKFKNHITIREIIDATKRANRNTSWENKGNLDKINFYSVGHYWKKLVAEGILELPGDMHLNALKQEWLMEKLDNSSERHLIAIYQLYAWNIKRKSN